MCYINGVKTHPTTGNTIGSIVVDSDVTFTAPNNLGSNKNGDDDVEGRIYYVEAYSGARTDSQVLASFNALKSRYGY